MLSLRRIGITVVLLVGGLVAAGIAAGCDDGYHHRRVSYRRHGGYVYSGRHVPSRVVRKVKNVRNVVIVDRRDHGRSRRDVRPNRRDNDRSRRRVRADRPASHRKEIRARTSRKASKTSRAKVERKTARRNKAAKATKRGGKAGRKSKQLRTR